MSLELKLLLENGLLPGGITLAAVVLVWLMESRLKSWAASGLVAFGWWAGVFFGLLGVVDFGLDRFPFWSDEPWQRLYAPLFGCILLASTATCCRQAASRHLLATSMAVFAAWTVMPRDESWKDMWPEHSSWMAAIVVSILVNQSSTEAMHGRKAERWVLWIWVASLGSVMALAASSYASMASFIFSGLFCTAAIAFLGSIRKSDWTISPISSAAILLACMTAWARFRGTAGPVWLTTLVLFSPTIVASIDHLAGDRMPGWCRVSLSAILSTVLTSIVVAYVLSVAAAEEW